MDPYSILGIDADATPDEVKKAYRREAMKWHPDRCDNSSAARERFHRAAEARQAGIEATTALLPRIQDKWDSPSEQRPGTAHL